MGNTIYPYTCDQVRDFDMVSYLSSIGHEPSKISGDNYWYLSPLRTEKTPSFKINRKLNRWYDHGIGKGGNIIDFAIEYHNCTIREFLQSLKNTCNISLNSPPSKIKNSNKKITIVLESSLTSPVLLNYCKQRGIPKNIASVYCSEISYRFTEKMFYAIGFKNDYGGFELRNAVFKCSSSPKTATTIKRGATTVAVFEGFFDFLSFQLLFHDEPPSMWDFCILNSLSFFKDCYSFLEEHEAIHLYLDNDAAGRHATALAIERNKKYQDESFLYKGFKDLNDWIINYGKTKGPLTNSFP
ncbi:MAG: toprim domain-containing protein [Chitinophagaceae bacterium]